MSADQCALLQDLSSNFGYHVIITVKCLLCCAGVCGIVYQWKKQGVRFLVHENSKGAFHFYYALNAFAGTIFVLSYLFELIRLRFACFVVDYRLILFTKATADCALFSAHHIIVVLSIERLYSSIYPAYFERNSNKLLAFLLSITVISVTWLYMMFCFSDRFQLFFETHYAALFEERELSLLALFSTSSSLIIFSLDVYLNFIRIPSDINPSLAISYQRSENRRVILTILPIELMEGSIALFFTVTTILHEKAFGLGDSSPIGKLLFVELTHYIMLNSLIIAIVIELRVARRSRETVTTTGEDVDYFEHLRRAWS